MLNRNSDAYVVELRLNEIIYVLIKITQCAIGT